MTAAAEVARLALATGIGPADLLAAPPEVYAELLAQVIERQEAEAREAKARDLRARLRDSVK